MTADDPDLNRRIASGYALGKYSNELRRELKIKQSTIDEFLQDHFNALVHDPAREFGNFIQQMLRPNRELSEREVQIIELVGKGMTNPEIALACGTAVQTVKNQVRTIFRKMKVESRTELALIEIVGGQPVTSAPLKDFGDAAEISQRIRTLSPVGGAFAVMLCDEPPAAETSAIFSLDAHDFERCQQRLFRRLGVSKRADFNELYRPRILNARLPLVRSHRSGLNPPTKKKPQPGLS